MGLFRKDDPIARLCRESGRWRLTGRSGDQYWVQATDHRPVKEIMVRSSEGLRSVLFQAWFPVRFPLDNPPSGLFGRVLLRNVALSYARWSMVIGESCEACLTVASLIPRAALDATLFDFVCREIRDEILGFHGELHNKFLYSPGPPRPLPRTGGPTAEVRFIEPDRPATPPRPLWTEEAWRILRDQAGAGRHRLPGPEG